MKFTALDLTVIALALEQFDTSFSLDTGIFNKERRAHVLKKVKACMNSTEVSFETESPEQENALY